MDHGIHGARFHFARKLFVKEVLVRSLPRSRTQRTSRDEDAHRYARTPPEKKAVQHNAAQQLARRGLRIGKTTVGKGVFATRRIVDGTCVGEIEGQVILDDNYESRYSFDLEGGGQLEPAPPFRFVNHSCEPNCAFELIEISPASESLSPHPQSQSSTSCPRKLLLFAICDIESGDELSIDYNWPASFAIRCQCKAPSCRGWIVDPKHLVPLD